MGNQTSLTSSQQMNRLKNYQLVARNDEGVIYRQKYIDQQTQQQYYRHFILKEHNYPNQSVYLQAYKNYKQQVAKSKIPEYHSNTLSIQEAIKQQQHHFCSNAYKIYTLYQYPQLTLKNEIEVRAVHSKYFQECELVAILQTCLMAIQQKEIKQTISFNTKSIFISPDGVIKVINNDLVDENYRHVLTQNIYYAPEKITNFNSENASEHGLKKEIIFSMGMTLLQVCSLEENYFMYDYGAKVIDETALQNKISQLGERYSTDLVELLANMLQINPNRRISILEIQRVLNKYDEAKDEGIQNWGQNLQMEKKCDELFEKSYEKATKMQSSTSSVDQPSIPNLISHQNSSRMSLTTNNPNLYHNKNINSVDGQFSYKVTPSYNPHSSINNTTANFTLPSTSRPPLTTNNNENLFTDPKLLQMIRKDLEDIEKSRTSRIIQTNNYQSRLGSVNNSIRQNDHFRNSIKQYQDNEYKMLKNCPQVESLAASVAYENRSANKRYVYEESSVKKHPDSLDRSIALSTNNFNSAQKSPFLPYESQQDQNSQRTVRVPLRQVDRNENIPKKQGFQIQQEIKKDMMKKKQANLVYLQEIYQDGVKYEGMSKDGLKEGYGKLIYNDGAYYEGYFHNDKICGKGVLFYQKDHPAYDGEWLQQQFNGYGQLYNEQPQPIEQFPYHNFNLLQNYWVKYEGQFKQDNKYGKGKIYLTSQQFIEAQFKDDMINGQGIFYRKDGQRIEGVWENNILVEER